jgi:hypothetical protein
VQPACAQSGSADSTSTDVTSQTNSAATPTTQTAIDPTPTPFDQSFVPSATITKNDAFTLVAGTAAVSTQKPSSWYKSFAWVIAIIVLAVLAWYLYARLIADKTD